MSRSKYCNKYYFNKNCKTGNLHKCTPTIFQGGYDPEAIYNSSLILKIMLQQSSQNCNCKITLFAMHAFTYIYNYMFHDSQYPIIFF